LRQVRPRWSLACGLPDAHPPEAMTIAAKLILLIVVFVAGMAAGVRWQVGVVAQRDLKQVQDNARVQILRADKADQAADKYEKTRTKIETRFVEVEKEVVRVVNSIEYRDRACLDPVGLRVLAAAINGDDAAGKPAPAVSSPVVP